VSVMVSVTTKKAVEMLGMNLGEGRELQLG
jgi:hypothetical protein